MNIVSFGCDPEIFVRNTDGEVCSAIGHFGGTKEKPKPIRVLGAGYAVQEDNILVEFNIPPANSPEIFVDSVQKTIDVLSKRALRKGLTFTKGSAFSVNPKHLQDPAALVFGCEPDYNAYTGQANPRPSAPDANLRSAGGHIALGIDSYQMTGTKWETLYNRQAWARQIVQGLDFLWGIPSLLLDDGDERRQLYGKAGAYRLKSFGVEYRTLSNFWIFSPEIAKAMLRAVQSIPLSQLYPEVSTEHVQVAIDTNNKEYAKWAVDTQRPLRWAREFIK